MSQSDRFDNLNNEQEKVSTSYDTYTTDSSADIYNTPNLGDVSSDSVPAEEIVAADSVMESMPAEEIVVVDGAVESMPAGEQASADIVAESSPVPQNTNQGNAPYNNVPYNNPYGANLYGGQGPQNNNGSYNNNPYNNSPYNNNPYNNSYNSDPYNGNQYNNQSGNNQYGGNPYGNNPYGTQNAQNTNPYGGYQYGNNQYGNNQYGNGPTGIPPYGNNPYSPYAVPPKKNKTGLIIGVVITIILLFLIAVFALVYRLMSINTHDAGTKRGNRDEYRFDNDNDKDDWRTERNKGEQDRDPDDHRDWFDYDEEDDDDYDDWDDWDDWDDYDDDSMYYDLHDDIRTDLSYSVDIEDFEYDTDNDNVDIWVQYPVIEGDNVPNLDKLNDAFRDEVDMITELFEDEYEDYLTDDDSYFMAYSVGYVTYMDEEKMSVVFDERIYSDYYMDVYLYCINIDMENGVIMDNEHILSIDDDFSVDFRERNDIQNGEIDYLTRLTDQEITKHFNSPGVIVFYTPMGMEIGFNYDEGWVTVTYEDYKQYLNVF